MNRKKFMIQADVLATSNTAPQLMGEISLPEGKQNFLFAALILTSFSTFIFGNLLLLDTQVLLRSLRIALPCWGMLAIFYMLSRVMHSIPWGLVLTYNVMGIVVLARQTWLVPVVYVLALVALGYIIHYLRVARSEWLILLLAVMIATLAIVRNANGSSPNYHILFDMLSQLNSGNVTQDTLYLSSIAAMIKNYGVISTGLQGLVETPYHVLSHVLYASMGLLSGLGVIEVYAVAPWLIFAPLIVFSTAVCVLKLDRTQHLRPLVVWGTACVVLTVIPYISRPWVVWDQIRMSESQQVALGLFLLALPLLFKRRLSNFDIILTLVLTLLSTLAKMAVGPFIPGLWLVRILFVRGESTRRDLTALALSAAAALWAVFTFSATIPDAFRISPLSFVVSYSWLGDILLETGGAVLRGGEVTLRMILLSMISVLSFFIFHFLLGWILVARVAIKQGFRAVFSTPMSVYALAVSGVGVALMLFIQIPGINNYWFSNVAFFTALPGVVSWLAQELGRSRLATRPLLVSCILLVGLTNIGNYQLSGHWNPEYNDVQPNRFITALIEVRQTAPFNEVLRPLDAVIDDNPVRGCSAAVFVYPAVSERPWVDVVGRQGACHYGSYYSFAEYGITDEHPTVAVPVRLLPGMEIHDWPDSLEGFK